MGEVKVMRRSLFSLLCCFGVILFTVTSTHAQAWDVSPPEEEGVYVLEVGAKLSVLSPVEVGPTEEAQPQPRGYEVVPVFDSSGNQVPIGLFDPVKIQVMLTIPEDFPLPTQVRVVFGGRKVGQEGFSVIDSRQWILRSDGEYSTSTFFTFAPAEAGDFEIGARIWVRYENPCDEEPCPILTYSKGLLESVAVGIFE